MDFGMFRALGGRLLGSVRRFEGFEGSRRGLAEATRAMAKATLRVPDIAAEAVLRFMLFGEGGGLMETLGHLGALLFFYPGP